MSGFEIAGLILGAVPLTVAALKRYKKAHEMQLLFRFKAPYIDRLIEALEEQEYLFETEFDMMLRAAGLGQQSASTISGECLKTALLRNDTAEELRKYLGRGYDPYRKALVKCENSLGEIVRSIGGLVPGSPSGDLKEVLEANKSKEGKYELTKRIKFSLKKDELDRKITEIILSTNSLRRLRLTSVSLHNSDIQSSSRTIAKFASFLQRIQRHANSLYTAIAQKLASRCHQEHGTRFYLEGQSAILQKRPLAINFKLAIEAVEARLVAGKLRHEVCIEVLEDHAAEYNIPMSPRFKKYADKRVRPNPPQQHDQSRIRFNLPDLPRTPNLSMTEVENLCLSLSQARRNSKITSLFLSQQGCLSTCHTSTSAGRVSPSGNSTSGMVTLEQVLNRTASDDRRLGPKWSLIQRMNLSFSLASSLLQLYSTPWLSEPWTKRAIYFWRLRQPSQASGMSLTFEPDRPFIVHSFPELSVACPPPRVNARHQLLDLGILLLEIGHERSFESWTSTHGYTLDRTYGSRYDAASEWLRDSQSELVPSYYDAIARCIECTFQTAHGRPIPDWEDPDFRKSICELVIKPLWGNCSTEVI